MDEYEGDDLLQMLRDEVRQLVPPELVEPTTQAAAITIVKVMRDPRFYNHLTLVQALQEQIAYLHSLLQQRVQPVVVVAPVKRPVKKAVKKAAVKKAPAKAVPRRRQAAFKRGARGR